MSNKATAELASQILGWYSTPVVSSLATGDDLSLDDPTTGFHAEIYQHAVTGEALVAITGTQNGQDWAANTALGEPQWSEENKNKVFAAINALTGATKLTFTGHSLGGALGQYATYDYLTTPLPGNQPHLPVSLVTFNGLGGLAGLQQMYGANYDPTIAAQIDAAHFYASSSGRPDLVTRLGAGHLGGDTYQIAMAPNHQCNRNQDGYAGSDGWRRAA